MGALMNVPGTKVSYYPAVLVLEDRGQFSVTFPDIPEAITYGNSREHALVMGLDALITSFEFYFHDDRPVPIPSPIAPGSDYVELPADVADRLRAHNAALS